MITPELLHQLLPLATAWITEQEAHILAHGQPLTAAQRVDASKIGVAYPERVRLLAVDQVPQPEHPALQQTAETLGFLSPNTRGITFRYGIYLQRSHQAERRLVVHELTHTAQYERLGGMAPFLERYLMECLTVGYWDAPLEQEARGWEKRIDG